MNNENEPTAEDMQRAVAELGELLRQPGDYKANVIARVAALTGLSERMVRAYFHREARKNHRAHWVLFQAKTSELNGAEPNELETLRTQIAELRQSLLETSKRLDRVEDNRAGSSSGGRGNRRGRDSRSSGLLGSPA